MSAKFTDRFKREWDLTLDLGTLTTVRESIGLELGKILMDHDRLHELLYGDVGKLGSTLFTILADQSKERGIDGTAFAKGFDGPTLEAARSALVYAIANFSHPQTIADEITESLRKILQAKIENAKTKIRTITTSMLSESDTSSPGS